MPKWEKKDASSGRDHAEEVIQSEENFTALFNLTPDPVCILDSKGEFLEINQKAVQILGYSKEELRGKKFFLTNALTNRSKVIAAANLAKQMIGIQVAPYVIELLTSNKKKIWFEINATKIKYKGKQANLIIFRDVSEREKMQQTIMQEQERFRDVANSTGDWIWETDADGRYTYSSPVVEQILGYKPEEVIGRNMFDFIPPEDTEQMTALIRKVFAGKERFVDFAIRAICKNGTSIFLEKNAIPMLSPEGELLGYRGLDRNVTERREMQQKLMKAERFATVGELAAMIAHDLRNPLQGIANGTYFLKTKIGYDDDTTTKEVFGLLEEAVQYSNKVVGDLIEYSREIQLCMEPTSVATLVNGAVSMIEVPKNVQVITEIDGESKIIVDADKMKRVFINLIKNSLEAMPNGGKLTIRTQEPGANIHFLFTDTGLGMTKETLDKLWTPLFTTKAKGMGFGLPICKRIVEAHGGQISIQSIVGQGTTCTITIPIKPEHEGGVEVWVNSPEYLSSTMTKQ